MQQKTSVSLCNMQRTIGRLLTFIIMVILTSFICASSAYADVGDQFSASTGTTDGSTVTIGTPLVFKVVSEPTGEEPGSVQVGNGQIAALDISYTGAVVIPQEVAHNGSSYRVVRTASNSFKSASLSGVTVPSTVQRIGSYSFYCCYKLAHLEYQGEPSITYIEGHAFEIPSATGMLESVRFPASLRSVGVYSFAGQSALKHIEFEGERLEFIGQYAFTNCLGLEEAHIPELTAASSSLGGYVLSGCTNLKLVVFEGNVASQPDELIGSRFFDNDTQLATVVYCGKKIIPSWKNYGSATDVYYEFRDSNPTLYYTITYFGSLADAQEGHNPLGAVCVRSDTRLCDIKPGMSAVDENGTIVWDGSPIALPEGYDAWGYEGNPRATDAPDDSLYAFPLNPFDLSSASISLDADSLFYTGLPIAPAPTIITASGDTLTSGVDYTYCYEREQDDGTWQAEDEPIAIGRFRVHATGVGVYTGECVATFDIAHAQSGDTFVSNGVTYVITNPTDGSFEGEASVGDGKTCAIPTDTQGSITIPSVVQPDASTVSYKVTALSSYAFGGSGASTSCAALEGVALPQGITEIGTYAFGYCSKLKAITLPASVRVIGSRAFQNCTNLSELNFEGDSVERFGTYSFAFCTSLTHIELPSATVFRDNVFANCMRLARVDFMGDIAQGDATQFSGCARLARVVFHTPNAWTGSFPASSPALYGVADFQDTTGASLGQAILRLGTPLSHIVPAIEKTYLLEGTVPAVPEGYGYWAPALSSATSFERSGTLVPAGTPGKTPDESDPDKPKDDDPKQPVDPDKTKGISVGKQAVGSSGVSKAIYRALSNNPFKVAYVASKSTAAKVATIPTSVKLNGQSYQVTKVAAKAFKGTKVKTVTVKSKTITSFKNAFKGSGVNTVIAPKAKKAAYKKLLTKVACGKAVTVKWK